MRELISGRRDCRGGSLRPNGMGANLIVRRSDINVGNGWDSSNDTHENVAVV